MDDPVHDVTDIVHKLTQGSPEEQRTAINEYFTPDAAFTHPFCRTGSFEGSRWLIHAIFRWYKIMSPTIELNVNSIAFDQANLILYVNISQVFSIWFIPFQRAPVTLTTMLHLVRRPGSPKYYIQAQNDLYQTDEFVRFVTPWGMGAVFMLLWQYLATYGCVVLAFLGQPFTRYMQRKAESNAQAGITGEHTYQRRVKELAGRVNGTAAGAGKHAAKQPHKSE